MMKISLFLIMTLTALVARAVEVRSEMNTNYRKVGQGQAAALVPGQSLSLMEGEQVVFSGENQLPILVVIPKDRKSEITLRKETSQDLMREATSKVINNSVNEIVTKLMSAEVMIKNKNIAQAKTLLQDLKEKYPLVSSVHFASGTTNFLSNNRTAAIADLEKGLTIDPENGDAKKLLERMKRDK